MYTTKPISTTRGTARGSREAVQSPLYRSGVLQSVANSTAEVEILRCTIPRGALGPNGVLNARVIADFLNNTGDSTNRLFTLRIKLGGTTVFADSSASITTNTGARPVFVDFSICNTNSESSQRMVGLYSLGTASSATTGTGDIAASGSVTGSIGGSAAVDTTAAVDLVITVQFATAHANLQFNTRGSYVSLI